ncbi:MAG: hypothetical protein J6M92_06015 [Oribacterium sp.]|nr:hypothetical protein [Oribacterium sp.]
MKWLDKLNEKTRKAVSKRIEKLESEIRQYRREFADRPWGCYQKAIDKREKELDVLQRFGDPSSAMREVEDYREEINRLKSMLGKCGFLASNIDPSDQKSHGNLMKLISMTSGYSFYDEDFKAHADMGVW